MVDFKLGLPQALAHLGQHPQEFVTLLEHGTLQIELYKPQEIDKQTPHDRDEIYVIASGWAEFVSGDRQTSVKAGDVLFVPAEKEHRFTSFSEDFSTWVFFYGPMDGEKGQLTNHLKE